MKKTNKAKIVRIGGIEEWYAPTYDNPVMENDGLYDLFTKLGLPYVYGPCIRKEERLAEDLGCICDRIASGIGCGDSDGADDVADAVEECLEDGKKRVVMVGGERIVITPYAEVPKIPETAYAEFGEYANLIKERVAAI